MDDEQFTRYSRHLVLPQIGRVGQQRLLDSRVLVVGAGGLGSPAAMYLASAGVGCITLADFDVVELSNLQRQIIHSTADVGRLKVESGEETLKALNPRVHISPIARVLADDELLCEVTAADVVVDASDNFETRFALNAACVASKTPLVSGAAQRMEGQVSVFHPGLAQSPCYHCLYSDDATEAEACSDTGVFAPLLGIVGSIQAAETLKLIIGMGESLVGRVIFLDALHMECRSLRLAKDPDCPVCADNAASGIVASPHAAPESGNGGES
jgi:adenylyltransferase/sulfurtransferase